MYANIEEIVKTYLKHFEGERESLNQLIDFIDQSKKKNKDIYNSKNAVGHITASGFIYDKSEKRLLLLKHKKIGKWLQPGGHIESIDNSILDAAKREIYEETGLKNLNLINISTNKDIPFDINTHFIPENPMKDMPAHYHHDFRFLFTTDAIKDVKIDENESNAYKWVECDKLQEDGSMNTIIEKINRILNNDFKKSDFLMK